jgi:hypothetical protein
LRGLGLILLLRRWSRRRRTLLKRNALVKLRTALARVRIRSGWLEQMSERIERSRLERWRRRRSLKSRWRRTVSLSSARLIHYPIAKRSTERPRYNVRRALFLAEIEQRARSAAWHGNHLAEQSLALHRVAVQKDVDFDDLAGSEILTPGTANAVVVSQDFNEFVSLIDGHGLAPTLS